MLEDIKKMQGICHNEFDEIIKNLIKSCILDLKAIGIAEERIIEDDPLIRTAIQTYALSFLDVNDSEMYLNSYNLQKDKLRHLSEYK